MKNSLDRSKPRRLPATLFLLVALVVLLVTASPARCAEQPEQDAAHHNQVGLEYFNKGFYDHTPRLQVQESGHQYRAAEDAFKRAIAADPFFVDAHRNLARLYHVQKNFPGAADEYKKVTELAPSDVDTYVNLALAYVESGRHDDAIDALEKAKSHTSDPKARDTLNRYIDNVRKHR